MITITNNDLNDLHYIFIRVRFRPLSPDNEAVLRAVLGEVNTELQSDNKFRQALMRLDGLKEEYWQTLLYENRYSYIEFIRDESVCRVLTTALQELLNAVQEKNENKIYDLADALHNLPTMINENGFKIPKFFWKSQLSTYRRKWNSSFLIEEQKKWIAGRNRRALRKFFR